MSNKQHYKYIIFIAYSASDVDAITVSSFTVTAIAIWSHPCTLNLRFSLNFP